MHDVINVKHIIPLDLKMCQLRSGGSGPTFSNLVLDRLDKYIEQTLIPAYTRGNKRKKEYYTTLIVQAFRARKRGDWENDSILHKQAQSIPSRDPNDPNYRRL